MSGKAGEKTVGTNNEQKHALGKSANACGNQFLASCRGQKVKVWYRKEVIAEGNLDQFDLYTMVISSSVERDGIWKTQLVFKGPGVVVELV